MNKLFALILLFFATLLLQSNNIDYQNKQLKKDLLKTWNVEITALVEIPELGALTANEGKFYKVLDKQQILGYVYVGRIKSCRNGGCTKDKTESGSGSSEYFDAYFLYNANKTVESVKVYNYRATHGHDVCSRGWLKQFIGFDNEEPLQVGKTIDGISGATISVYALTDEVNYVTQILRKS
jgi:Na+-translocating ferredoxin:NAD+ oxidoreductase RnfG subunit